MANLYQHDEISLTTLKSDFEGYSWKKFRMDISAGLTCAFLTVPQAMAYALVAGLPLSCGLFASIFAALVAAIFGSSRHLAVGPSNAIAILVQVATADILFTYFRDLTGFEREITALQLLTQLVLLVGVFQILTAVFRLGSLTQFVSHSVIVGYIVGAAFAVLITQLYTFFGIPSLQGIYSLYQKTVYLIGHFDYVHLPTAAIGIGSLILLMVIKRVNSKIPAAAIVLILAGIAVHVFGLSSYTSTDYFDPYADEIVGKVSIVGDAGEVYGIWPKISLPFFNPGIMNHMLPYAFAIALLSILETTSIAKSIAASSGQHLSINQEIFGLGLSNIFGSCITAMPCSGSPSRSTLLYNNGGQTRFAAIFNSLFVVIILFAFGYFVTRIPLAALAALLLVNAANIINLKQIFLCLKATKADAFVLFATFFSCMFFSLHIAFYIGIALSITLYLRKAAVPQLVECTFDDTGKFENINCATTLKGTSKIRMINVQGELFFGAADLFQTTLKALTEDDNHTKVIILRLKSARDIDATACLALEQLYEYLKSSNRFLVCCGLTDQSWKVLCDSGFVELIGKENLFIYDERHPNNTVQKAISRAKAIIRTKDFFPSHIHTLPEQEEDFLEAIK